MIDMVPKAITLTLVNFAKENLQRQLLQELYKPEVLDDLLKESEYTVARRKEVVAMIQALNKAEEYVYRRLLSPFPLCRLTLTFLGSLLVCKHPHCQRWCLGAGSLLSCFGTLLCI